LKKKIINLFFQKKALVKKKMNTYAFEKVEELQRTSFPNESDFKFEYGERSHPDEIIYKKQIFKANLEKLIVTHAGYVLIYENDDKSSLAVKFIKSNPFSIADVEIKKNQLISAGLLIGSERCRDVLLELLHVSIVKNGKYVMLLFKGLKYDLHHIIFDDDDLPSFVEINEFLMDTSLALLCLHQMKLIYGDLKPENILISNDGAYILADFETVEEEPKFIRGSQGYMSLGRLMGKNTTLNDDLWSLSVVLFCFLTKEKSLWIHKSDFTDKTKERAVLQIQSDLSSSWNENDLEFIIDLFIKLNAYQEEDRINLDELLDLLNPEKMKKFKK
jgi:serine/threonine protein kinase